MMRGVVLLQNIRSPSCPGIGISGGLIGRAWIVDKEIMMRMSLQMFEGNKYDRHKVK